MLRPLPHTREPGGDLDRLLTVGGAWVDPVAEPQR